MIGLRANDGYKDLCINNAKQIAERFLRWQKQDGSVDRGVFPYKAYWAIQDRSIFASPFIREMAEALYRLYEVTKEEKYKICADKYVRYYIANTTEKTGVLWQLGTALEAFGLYRKHNPNDASLDNAVHRIYSWAKENFWPDNSWIERWPPDQEVSNDISLFGSGLMDYYNIFQNPEVLDCAIALSKFFTADYKMGSRIPETGFWSPVINTWLIGTLSRSGAEMLSSATFNRSGWVATSSSGVDFLAKLFAITKDPMVKEKAVCSMKWAFDSCQFPDGAVGIGGRDDKWLGFTGAVIRAYRQLAVHKMLDDDIKSAYFPKVEKAIIWLMQMTDPKKFPKNGVVYVTHRTRPSPDSHVVWMDSWTIIGLIDGIELLR